MPNVPVLIGEAPTTNSTLRERNAAEKAGYLIDRGDHLEWHRDHKAWLWALPHRPAANRPGVAEARLRPTAPGKGNKTKPRRVRGFVLDGPSVAQQQAGAAAPPVPGSVRWWLAWRRTGWILLGIALSALILGILALAVLADGNFDLPFGAGGGKAKGKGPHLYLLDAEGRVLGAVSDFDLHNPRNQQALAVLRTRAIHVDLPTPPGAQPQPPPHPSYPQPHAAGPQPQVPGRWAGPQPRGPGGRG